MRPILALVLFLLASGMLFAQPAAVDRGKTPTNIKMTFKVDGDTKTLEAFGVFWAGSGENITLPDELPASGSMDYINFFLLSFETVQFQQCLLNESPNLQCPPTFHECKFPGQDLLSCDGRCCSEVELRRTDEGGTASAVFQLEKSIVAVIYSGNSSLSPARAEERVYLPGESGYEPWQSPLLDSGMDIWLMIGGTVASLVAFLVFIMLFKKRRR